MDSQGNMSFTNLLQEDSNLDKELLGESQHTPMSIQESLFQVYMIPSKSKRQASNFTVEEDKLLIRIKSLGKAEKAKRKRKDNEKEDVVVFMERKTKFLEDAREVEKELIRMKGEKIRLEELRMMEKTRLEELRMTEKINIEKERLHFEQAKEDGRMRIEEERMHIEEERMRMEDERMRREEERLQL
uniref:No apical meristem-associated C-terminal domain-containing protein n=1 Tax=Fagus sylvatica TaxID=28930 RepID=A0A2N9HRJ6_FAGSY